MRSKMERPEYQNFEMGVRDADYIFDTRFHFGEWLEPYSEESGDPAEQDLGGTEKAYGPIGCNGLYVSLSGVDCKNGRSAW